MNANAVQRAYVKTVRRAPKRYAARAGPSRALVAARGPLSVPLRRRTAVMAKESGYVDLAAASRPCDTTGSITLVATIPQGNTVNTRVGKKVLLKSLQIRGYAVAGTAGNYTTGAIIFVYDKRPTGSLPAITDVLVSVSSRSMNNDDNAGRFKILRRIDLAIMGNSTTPATGQELRLVNDFIDLKGLPAVYKSLSTGAIGDIEQGAVYVITCGTDPAGTSAIGSSFAVRTRFVDV